MIRRTDFNQGSQNDKKNNTCLNQDPCERTSNKTDFNQGSCDFMSNNTALNQGR